MELYIIRHGQSANNALDDAAQVRRHYDPPLTELGLTQSAALAAYFGNGANRDPQVDPSTGFSRRDVAASFGITHLYCSAMHRALQTAQPLGRAIGLQPEIWIDIHEHGGIYLEEGEGRFTGYPGRTRAEIEAEFPGYVIPQGVSERGWWRSELGQEPRAAAFGRAIATAWELRRRAEAEPDSRIALVSHGTFIDALLKAIFGQLPSRQFFYLHYNTGITRLDFMDKDRVLIRFGNRTAHLTPDQLS